MAETAVVGITDHAQAALGDLVFVETPEVGASFDAGDACAVVESVKAASDVYSPLAGEVTEANADLADTPELVNQDPYGDGWLFAIKLGDEAEVAELLDERAPGWIEVPVVDDREAVRALAERTGGTAIVNTNDVGPGLERVATDFDTYYSLGYASPAGGSAPSRYSSGRSSTRISSCVRFASAAGTGPRSARNGASPVTLRSSPCRARAPRIYPSRDAPSCTSTTGGRMRASRSSSSS